MKKVFRWYFSTSLLIRILACFVIGAVVGGVLWAVSRYTVGPGAVAPGVEAAIGYIDPFGAVFVGMLKMIVKNELASFSLPLGATINMDGVCVHLPMFAVLAANMFGIELTFASLLTMVVTTVLASVGAGGVPGGSLMLLFIILENAGLGAEQVSVVVALALGINPILDMFETANNVTGDLVCTYAVAEREKLVESG